MHTRPWWRTGARLALLGAVIATGVGCLSAVPTAAERAATPLEVGSIYRASGDRYLEEAAQAFASAQRAANASEARRALDVAWRALEEAWERFVLGADAPGLARTIEAAALANPGLATEGLADGLTLMADMMKRLRQADAEVRGDPAIAALLVRLEERAESRPTSSLELQRAFAIERELWTLGGQTRDDPHYQHLLDLLELAETAPDLRGAVGVDWRHEASASLRGVR